MGACLRGSGRRGQRGSSEMGCSLRSRWKETSWMTISFIILRAGIAGMRREIS